MVHPERVHRPEGFGMRPFIIVSHATTEKDPAYSGYDRHDVALASQEIAFMTSSILPALEERRGYFRSQGKAVLLLDGLGLHNRDQFLQACSERDIEVVLLVPDSSNQTSSWIS
jgi:hypothetical protein